MSSTTTATIYRISLSLCLSVSHAELPFLALHYLYCALYLYPELLPSSDWFPATLCKLCAPETPLLLLTVSCVFTDCCDARLLRRSSKLNNSVGHNAKIVEGHGQHDTLLVPVRVISLAAMLDRTKR